MEKKDVLLIAVAVCALEATIDLAVAVLSLVLRHQGVL